eukprot:TRINITY_DN12306_c0_g1_i1.p1 TRINITY_DN12306_c0_g1~~TRINITY_DN12306_c0_g1_i1.p1  ORF type:complete len:2265 (+),score=849.66 TRINITY_DN12306_c0_g1_i1:87-6881(+)
MAGMLPDSTPGIRPAQWLEVLEKQQAEGEFCVQLQLLTDEQMLSSSKGQLNRALNQPARTLDERRAANFKKDSASDSSTNTDPAMGDVSDSDEERDSNMDDGEVASTHAGSQMTKASEMSNLDPTDNELDGDQRSQGRSEVNSQIGLEDVASEGGGSEKTNGSRASKAGGKEKDAAGKAQTPRLTAKALETLNKSNRVTESYNDTKRKLRKHLDKRRTGRVQQSAPEGLPSCFHAGGLYDPRLGSCEVKRSGKDAGRWHVWCATCNEGKLPACPQCGEALMHSYGKGEKGKKQARMAQCIACGCEVRRESLTVDPNPSCPGHYGHIKMPRDMWLVNPLQWDDVIAMLRGKCWWCHRWRAPTFEIRRRVATLKLLNARLWTPGMEEYMDKRFTITSGTIEGTAAAEKGKPGRKAKKEKGAKSVAGDDNDTKSAVSVASSKATVSKAAKGFKVYTAANADEAGVDLMQWVCEKIADAEVSQPMASRQSAGSLFAKRRESVNELWRILNATVSSAKCRHCGLINPRRITDLRKTAVFYDMSGKDMEANITNTQDKAGPKEQTTWEEMKIECEVFKTDTEINKGGGQVVHYKKDGGRAGGRGKPMREAAPRGNVYLPPHKIQHHLQHLFDAEQESLGEIFFLLCSAPDSKDPNLQISPRDYWKAFLHRVVEVGPNKFRPFREGDSKIQADDQTKQVSNLIVCAKNVQMLGQKYCTNRIAKEAKAEGYGKSRRLSSVAAFWKARPRTFEFVARSAQDSYRRIMFAPSGGGMNEGKPAKGAQQVFEKKSGLFRTNLMGKRVNQACRSVISPDNNLEDDQVLLSRRFAKKLTIPEVLPTPVSVARLEKLALEKPHLAREAEQLQARRGFLLHSVLNGPTVYPGATRVEMDAGDPKQVSAAYQILKKARRPHFLKKELTLEDMQLVDVARMKPQVALDLVLWMEAVLCKAQTDRKPGAMGLGVTTVRFKVFRHVATDDWVILNRQPTLHKSSWLGQRLVVGTSERTIRFHYANCKGFNADFDGDEMNVHVPQTERAQMELKVLNNSRNHFISSTSGKPLRGLIQDHVVSGVLLTSRNTFLSGTEYDQLIYAALQKLDGDLPPRPEPALRVRHKVPKKNPSDADEYVWVESWTGKQLITAVLQYLTVHFSQVGKYAGGISFEGRSALPATVWDPRPSSEQPPFITDKAMDDDQIEVIQDYYVRGVIDKNQLGATGGTLVQHVHEVHGPQAAGTLTCIFGRLLTEYLKHYGFTVGIMDLMLTSDNETLRAEKLKKLDEGIVGMKTEGDRLGAVMKMTGELNKELFPKGLAKSYPDNCLSLMTMSGAKGSGVNGTQMSVLLGQQTFDGHRVECMPSGKTLPGTLLGDDRASCGGFGCGRFLSGIRPQQYVVHAAAGRDGLIDTAVKTARSGYLQRSVIKGMEGLATKALPSGPAVIDEAGGIVQLKFGVDGLDPQRSAGWSGDKPPAAVAHHADLAVAHGLGKRKREWRGLPNEAVTKEQEEMDRCQKRTAELVFENPSKKIKFTPLSKKAAPQEISPGTEVFLTAPDGSDGKPVAPKPIGKERVMINGVEGYVNAKSVRATAPPMLQRAVQKARDLRQMAGQMACDEPVGIIAAQSVGEPSTQMTLNTFHQAGQTVSHVTEGIPRLRQILQSASVGEPMVLLPVESMTPTVAKALLRLHSLLNPKPLLEVLRQDVPYTCSSVTQGIGEHYKTIRVVFNIDEAKLKGYYVGEYGIVSTGAPGKKKKKKDGKDDKKKKDEEWLDWKSDYRREREAMGLLRKTAAPPPKAPKKGDDKEKKNEEVRALVRLDDKKLGGAVGDVHGVLNALNKVLVREVQRSWDWDKIHDSCGFDGRRGACLGNDTASDPNPTGYNPGHRSDPEPIRKYADGPDGKPVKVQPLAFEDIVGSVERSSTNPLALPAFTRYVPYSGKASVRGMAKPKADAEAANGVGDNTDDAVSGMSLPEPINPVKGEKVPGAKGKKANGDKARPAVDKLSPTEQRSLHSLAISVRPYGVCRAPTAPGVLQYHVSITVPCHVNLMLDDLIKRSVSEITLRRHELKGIKRAFFVPNNKGTGGVFHIDGGQLKQLHATVPMLAEYPDVFQSIRFDKVRTTDHSDMVATMGVEAGQKGLLEELKRLFKSYSVDERWLTLVTDRAFFSGKWKGFSRFSVIAQSPSILSRMTFETATKFLASATKEGLQDDMKSPAARIMFGQELAQSSSTYKAKGGQKLVGTGKIRTPVDLGQGVVEVTDVPLPAVAKRKGTDGGADKKRRKVAV